MKYYIALYIILFPVFVIAQIKNPLDSLADACARKLLDSAMRSTFGIGSSNEVEANLKEYNQFKVLFDSTAKIDDDFNAVYDYGSKTYKLKSKAINFDEYAHDVALQIKRITVDSVYGILPVGPFTDLKNLTYRLYRIVTVQKTRQYVIGDTKSYVENVFKSRKNKIHFFNPKEDSVELKSNFEDILNHSKDSVYEFRPTSNLQITIIFNEKDSTCKIKRIEKISTYDTLNCVNDDDGDAILNGEDSLNLKNTFGDFTANGRSDDDLDGFPDLADKCPHTYGAKNKGCPVSYFVTKNAFDGFIGLQLNSAKINLPELNQLGYRDQSGNDAMDVLQSKKGVLKNPANLLGVYAGANFTYYFGKKRKASGVSVGLTYSKFTAGYELTDPIIYTFKSFDGINFYRRQISINSLKEAINHTIFNFPVMFNYRKHVDKKDKSNPDKKPKTVINLKAGPSLMLFNNTSNYNAVIDFAGLYQVDTIKKNAITFYDHFDQGSTYNVFFTSDSINSRNPSPGADIVFSQLGSKNYDFANNKSYNGKRSNLKRITVALNLDIDVQHKISEGLTIEVGAHFVYAPLLERKEKYKPVDKTTDEYQSIYNSTAKSNYSALGVHVGFVYDF